SAFAAAARGTGACAGEEFIDGRSGCARSGWERSGAGRDAAKAERDALRSFGRADGETFQPPHNVASWGIRIDALSGRAHPALHVSGTSGAMSKRGATNAKVAPRAEPARDQNRNESGAGHV